MIRSRSWRRKQNIKNERKREFYQQQRNDRTVHGTARKHAAHPEDCGIPSCLICHPEKNVGNSNKVQTRKSAENKLLEREMAEIQQLPLPELEEQY